MTGGPRPQCESSIVVFGLARRCQSDADHVGYHHYDGGYKSPTIEWFEPRWQSMIFTGAS